ncbi:MAG: hypothetical protein D3904_17050 [Candidatus Electrothrix sp. EH2]|nr:hypothetical protein [Candidatus Electrothrix sp. EH2]
MYPEKLTPASTAADRLREKLTRLYEQGADNYRIGCFLLRWCAAFRGGEASFPVVESDMMKRCLFTSVIGYCRLVM